MPEFPPISAKQWIIIPFFMLIAIEHFDATHGFSHQPDPNKDESALLVAIKPNFIITDTLRKKSPYAGQQTRFIKALSQQETEAILAGSGIAFGGMAKAAELNGYPGPKHVLELHEAGRMDLYDEQLLQIRALFEEMREKAIGVGGVIVELERELDALFVKRTVTPELLERAITQIGTQKAKLRNIHLQAHLRMMNILTPEQIHIYNVERGYMLEGSNEGTESNSADPCDRVPDGHDPVMWRMHNGCN